MSAWIEKELMIFMLVFFLVGLCSFLKVLAEGFFRRDTLTALDLSHNKIGDTGAKLLAKLLIMPSSVLTSLDLSNNSLTSEGASFMGKALESNSVLQSLTLRLNRLHDKGGKAIFHHLEEAPLSSLTALNISACGLAAHSYDALVSLVAKPNSPLVSLDLSCNNLGGLDRGEGLMKALRLNNHQLLLVDLRKNEGLSPDVDAGESLERVCISLFLSVLVLFIVRVSCMCCFFLLSCFLILCCYLCVPPQPFEKRSERRRKRLGMLRVTGELATKHDSKQERRKFKR